MTNKKLKLRNGKVISMGKLFRAKEQYHRDLSKLPFEEKMKIWTSMRRIVELKEMT